MKRFVQIILVTLMVSAAMFAVAHEFWMQPLKFYYLVGEKISISFQVGENFVGDGWALKKERLLRVEHHDSKGMKDIAPLAVEAKTEQLSVDASVEGTQVIVMESTPAFIELEAEKFNDYLKEDGLDEIFNERVKKNASDQAGKEFYSRHTKLIVQVGNRKDELWKKVQNLPIEIIPEQNPAELKVGSKISFKILFEGKPLFGAKVRVFNRFNNRTTMQPIFSQQDGRIEAHVSNPGPWMISVVKMVPSTDPKADWRSYWGSLVFGVK